MRDVSEESLLDYFYSVGGNSGRVRNSDMLKTFKPFIGHSDLQLRAKYREEFKLVIDRIAVVKSENGEKYLVLKKKYRQLLQERDAGRRGTDGEQPSPSRLSHRATAEWEAPNGSTSAPHQKEHLEELMSRGEPGAEDQRAGPERPRSSPRPPPVIQINELSVQGNGEDEADRDSASKSESDHDEECTGSVGSAAVALDPTEKAWIYSAASARIPDLSQLLTQDPSLANKKDFTSGFTALHWAAKHGSEDMATLVVNAGADVNTKSHGGYTPLHIAALHGHRHILDLLIGTHGAKENLRDCSGRLFRHYLNTKDSEGPREDFELQFHVSQARERNKNRKLASLFHSKKKWGSAEELAPIEEEKSGSHQLVLPAFRPRKFSR